MDRRTIAAIATPTGRGGIGIIRISGDNALEISLSVFKHPETRKDRSIRSHQVYYGFIEDTGSTVIDEVILLYMKAPRSYTAEDVVEIQSHSSPLVLRKILDLLIDKGAELAAPGEFTKRAYLNGRIDLTQAEAVIDIINAKTGVSLDMAVSQIQGNLKTVIQSIIEKYTWLQKNLEAVIDFPDEAGDIINEDEFTSIITHDIIGQLKKLENNFNDSNIFRDGIKIVIAGPPNSGKSSLLNNLLNKDKSIVTSIPGTTRDIIDDIINIDGIPFIITDTAGIQLSDDRVEQIGIKKTFRKIEESDLILLMFDAVSQLTPDDINRIQNLYNDFKHSKKIIVIENKIDLSDSSESHIQLLKPDIRISVLKNLGIDELKNRISDIIISDLPENRDSVVPNIRHYKLIQCVINNTKAVLNGLNSGLTYELLAIEIGESMDILQEIIGNNTKIDILDEIFSSFCIGK